MALIQFVRNYDDLSTDRGYQFKFYCDRCGNGYETQFQGSATGTLNDVLGTASSLLGGVFGNLASAGERVHSAAYQQSKDAAFRKAIDEVKPSFKQCHRCSKWVDTMCWNPEKGLCKDCAPDLEAEFSVAQSQAAIEQAQEVARGATYVTADKFKQPIVATCANCGADVKGAKFCPECGTPVKHETKCKSCGAETSGAKFCPECGVKQ